GRAHAEHDGAFAGDELKRPDGPQSLAQLVGSEHVEDLVAVMADRAGGKPAPDHGRLEHGLDCGQVGATHRVQPATTTSRLSRAVDITFSLVSSTDGHGEAMGGARAPPPSR